MGAPERSYLQLVQYWNGRNMGSNGEIKLVCFLFPSELDESPSNKILNLKLLLVKFNKL